MSALPVPMEEKEARQVTQRLHLLLGGVGDGLAKVADLLEKAKAGEVWRPLGYSSWTTYMEDEFKTDLAAIRAATERADVAKALTEAGMSLRSAAKALGVGKSTVARDLAEVSQNGTPAERPPATGRDGKTYPRPATFLPSGKPDAASTEAIGNAVPPVKVPRPVSLPKLIARIIRDLDALADRLADLDDDQRDQYGEELADLAISAEMVTHV